MLREQPDEVPSLRRVLPATLVLGAIVTHLASELFGMGGDDDAGVLFSPRHAYLALAGIVCLIFLAVEIRRWFTRAAGPRDLKRALAVDLLQLPFRADWRFFALGGALQLVLGLGTAVGEGCFFCGHDVVFGVAGAVLTSMLLALLARVITARLPRLAAALAAELLPAAENALATARPEAFRTCSLRPVFWSPHLANRPPPVLS